MDIKKINECPDCASTNIVHNEQREQIICRDCGLILEPFATLKPAETNKKTTKKTKKPVKKTKAKKKR